MTNMSSDISSITNFKSFLFLQEPVHHESLLLDRSDQILSEHEKREARRNYEREKKAMSCVGVDGNCKKTYAQIAKEFRLYSDRFVT